MPVWWWSEGWTGHSFAPVAIGALPGRKAERSSHHGHGQASWVCHEHHPLGGRIACRRGLCMSSPHEACAIVYTTGEVSLPSERSLPALALYAGTRLSSRGISGLARRGYQGAPALALELARAVTDLAAPQDERHERAVDHRRAPGQPGKAATPAAGAALPVSTARSHAAKRGRLRRDPTGRMVHAPWLHSCASGRRSDDRLRRAVGARPGERVYQQGRHQPGRGRTSPLPRAEPLPLAAP
jgi:hypothetical protein